MADHAANNHILSNDLWEFIASFLDEKDLATFKQLCQATLFAGFRVEVSGFLEEGDLFSFRKEAGDYGAPLSGLIVATLLQPLYNRLHAMDNTLPALLPQERALLVFKQDFAKIHARQKEEVVYLTKHHPQLMANPACVEAFQESTPVSLKALETRNAVLDEINRKIIQSKINPNEDSLNLTDSHLTRFPVSLFQEREYIYFWRNLTNLYCCRNQLTHLNLQGLVSLKILWCNNNQLTSLNVQGLKSLKTLLCNRNKLTSLNVQGLALNSLYCDNNQLTALNVQSLSSLETLDCSKNSLKELKVQRLTALRVLHCEENQLTSLNAQELKSLEQLWCKNNQLSSLNIQGLVRLKMLDICGNLLSQLDAQGLRSLRNLWCDGNQFTELNLQGLVSLEILSLNERDLLETLNLTGVSEVIKNQYGELEQSLLAKKLKQTDAAELTSPWARPIIFSTQNEENQTKDKSNNKRKRDECDGGNQPKRAKKG